MMYKFKVGDLVKSSRNNYFEIVKRFKEIKHDVKRTRSKDGKIETTEYIKKLMPMYSVKNHTTGAGPWEIPAKLAHKRWNKVTKSMEKILFGQSGHDKTEV